MSPSSFGISSEFDYGALRVIVQSINTDTVPATATLVDDTGETYEIPLREAIAYFHADSDLSCTCLVLRSERVDNRLCVGVEGCSGGDVVAADIDDDGVDPA